MADKTKYVTGAGGAGAVYGLGLIGAIIFYIQHSNTLGQALIGIIKALIWPAIVVYKTLEFLRLG